MSLSWSTWEGREGVRLFMYFYLNNMTSLFAINSISTRDNITLMLIYLWLDL